VKEGEFERNKISTWDDGCCLVVIPDIQNIGIYSGN